MLYPFSDISSSILCNCLVNSFWITLTSSLSNFLDILPYCNFPYDFCSWTALADYVNIGGGWINENYNIGGRSFFFYLATWLCSSFGTMIFGSYFSYGFSDGADKCSDSIYYLGCTILLKLWLHF